MNRAGYILLVLFAGLMLYAAAHLPETASPEAPLHRAESLTDSPVAGHYYIEHAYKDAHTPNMVTVVLADYRSFDTLGESLVVFAAGIACIFVMKRNL